jgi:hypothetical protein
MDSTPLPSIIDTRYVPLVKNSVMNYGWGYDRIVIIRQKGHICGHL